MANRITHRRYGDTTSVGMSNGLTDLFFVVLALSSSALAQTPHEERIALWIAQHDQAVRGNGAVSFDLSGGTADLARLSLFPWTFSQFATEKAFLLSAIDDALQGHRWRREGFFESDQNVLDALAKFRHMVKRCREQYLDPETPYDLPSTIATSSHPLERCSTHGIILHQAYYPGDHQCIACNAQLFLRP
jgi:hypothetical protein